MSELGTPDDAQQELETEILAAITAGRKLEAIKLLRDEYGMGLVEAKDIADELMAASAAVDDSSTLPPLGMEAGAGRLIANARVDELQGAGPVNEAAGGMPQPMQMETGLGRLIGVLLVVATVAAGYWLLG